MPDEPPCPRASYANTSRPRAWRAVGTAANSGLSLVPDRPCTSTTAARASPAADHERAASSMPSLVVSMVMPRGSVLRARRQSAGSSRDDRNVVIAQRLLEPDGGRPDRGSDQQHSTDGLGGHERADGLAHQEGDAYGGVGQVH